MSRQLAAILFSDIVGYTTMMSENESATLELVRRSRDIQKPLVEKHRGIWLKEMGDGAMAQFQSALDAVRCAIEIQEHAATRLQGQLRIGIHLGDITIENNEVYGDGINVASRIEAEAMPGSIYISEAVQGAIKGNDIQTSFRGERKLKNVDQPVRVYQIVDQEEVTSNRLSPSRSLFPWLIGLAMLVAFAIWKLSDSKTLDSGKTIAVLPLKLQNADSTNEYLVAGITEELIRSIGKLGDLTVISPLSTMRFMASAVPVQQASAELPQSDFLLSGTLEESNDQLKLNLALYNQQQQELWSNQYRGDIYELPRLTGTIAIDLAEFIRINLNEREVSRIVDIEPVDPETFRLMILGKNHLAKFTPQDIAIGLNYFRQAVDNSPTSSRAWSNLAQGLTIVGHSPAPTPGVWEEARAAATRALQLDSLNAEAWAWLGTTKTYYHWDYRGAEYCYNRANDLNPNLPMSHYHYSWHLCLFDSLPKAVKEHEIAFKLDPLDPFQAARLGHIYMIAGNMEQALAEIRRSQQLESDFVLANMLLGEFHMGMQQFDSAEYYLKKTDIFGKGQLAMTYFASGNVELARKVIEEMESNINPYYAVSLAMVYSQLGDVEKFFKYANHPQPHAFHPWLRVFVTNRDILVDPRFKELMDKMNLPMPVVPQEQQL